MKHRTSILRLCFTVIVPSTAIMAAAPSTPPDSTHTATTPTACAPVRQLISPVFPRTLVEGPILRGFQFAGSTAMLRGSTAEHTVAASALLGPAEGRWNGTIYGAFRDRRPHDLDGDAFSDITSLRSNVFGFTGNALPDGWGVITLDASMAAIDSRGGNSFHLPAHEADAAEERNLRALTGALGWQREGAAGTFAAEATFVRQRCNEYFGTERDSSAYGTHRVEGQSLETGYTTAQYPALDATAESRTALHYTHEILRDEAPGYGRRFTENRSRFHADFEQLLTWKEISASAGLTLAGHNLINAMMALPSAEVQWQATPALSFTGTVASGYEAPGLREADVQMEPVSGAVLLIAPSVHLAPERNTAYTLGAVLEIPAIEGNIHVELIRTITRNAFFFRQSHSPDSRYLTAERINGGSVHATGATLHLEACLSARIGVQAAITLQRAAYDTPQDWGAGSIVERPFFTPEVFGEAVLSALIAKGLEFRGTARYTGPMVLPHYTPGLADNHTETAPAFLDLGMMFSYDMTEQPGVALVGGVSNLLNHYQPWLDPDCDSAEAISQGPTRPRAYFAGVRVTL